METLALAGVVICLIAVFSIGAAVGHRFFNGNIRKGGILVALATLILMAGGVYLFSKTRSAEDLQRIAEEIEAKKLMDFMVMKDCDSYLDPSLESEVDKELKEGEVYAITDRNKYKFFYTLTWKDGGKSYVLKENMKSVLEIEAEEAEKERLQAIADSLAEVRAIEVADSIRVADSLEREENEENVKVEME